MRRLKLIVVVTSIMATLLAMNAGHALADNDGCIAPRADNGNCIGIEEDRNQHDWDLDRHDFFISDFDDFGELDECEVVGYYGNEAIIVCEIDF